MVQKKKLEKKEKSSNPELNSGGGSGGANDKNMLLGDDCRWGGESPGLLKKLLGTSPHHLPSKRGVR